MHTSNGEGKKEGEYKPCCWLGDNSPMLTEQMYTKARGAAEQHPFRVSTSGKSLQCLANVGYVLVLPPCFIFHHLPSLTPLRTQLSPSQVDRCKLTFFTFKPLIKQYQPRPQM